MRALSRNHVNRIAATVVIACGIGHSISPAHAALPAYRLAARQVLDGPVRWDYLAVDSARHRVFLTRGDHVDVFDAVSKSVIGTIANTPGVHGVAIAADRDRGYTSNGGNDTVTVFNDATAFDVERKLAFASNGDGTLTVIDGQAPHQVLQTVTTMPRARTMALDSATHAVFLVGAEAEPGPLSAGKTRPGAKAGTFTLLTFSPQ